jgi:glycosyltransferase involved in cell wall biosynthesis
MSEILFTVFTPTYNRAHTLTRVYQSLVSQTLSDFEWLIVDDGSEDKTQELVDSFLADGKIQIRYFRQPNSGKHVALNRAVREAQGELFLTLVSDDSCVPTALEQFGFHWRSIAESRHAEFSGITCFSRNSNGDVIGGRLPSELIDGHPHQIASQYHLAGDKWGFHGTAILRKYPFPVFPGENSCKKD